MKVFVLFLLTLLLLTSLSATLCCAQRKTVSPPTIRFETLSFRLFSGDTIFYEYGKLNVAENRARLYSGIVELAVVRLKAKTVRGNDPIVFLSGGPGESGIDYLKEAYFQPLWLALQEEHDILLLDQRGTGRSLPSLQFKLPDTDNRQLFLSADRVIALTKEAALVGTTHFKDKGIDITGYNTLESAADVEELRKAVGAERINLLAFSYGTHLALATARKYPANIACMVLVGPSGLDHIHHLPSTYDKQLTHIAQLAAKDSAVNREVPDLLGLLQKVLNQLEAEPVSIRIRDYKARQTITVLVGKFGLQFLLRLDAGDSQDFVYFPALLYGIDTGDYRLLQKYAERRYNQYNYGYGSGIFAVRQASGASQERQERIRKEGKTALLGNAMNTPDLYAGYEKVDLGDAFRSAFPSWIPCLFISGSLDSNTPSSNVKEISRDFTHAYHLVVENAAHEDLLPSKAVQREIISFFKSKTTPASSISLPIPRFIPIF